MPYRLADLITLIDERVEKLENRSTRLQYLKLIAPGHDPTVAAAAFSAAADR